MPVFFWILFVVGLVVILSMALVQAFHPSPWVRGQVERVYGPAAAMGWMIGMLTFALLTKQ